MAKKNKKAKKTKKANTAQTLATAIKAATTATRAVAATAKKSSSSKSTSSKSVKDLANQGVAAVSNAAAQNEAAIKARKRTAAQKVTAKSMQNTKAQQQKQRGGVVLSDRSQQRKQAAEKARTNLLKATGANKTREEKQKDTKDAIAKGKERNALGTTKQKHEKEYDTGLGVTREILKGHTGVMGGAIIGQATADVIKDAKKLGWTDEELKSEEGQAAINEVLRDVHKEVQKEVQKTNAELDKTMPSKVKYSYEDLTQADYNRLAVATQQGQLDTLLKSDKALAQKVADLNVEGYAKGAFGMGILDQMTQGLSVSQNPVYNYSDEQKLIMERQKTRGGTGYNAGRLVGGVAEFGLGGTSALGSGLVKTTGKTLLKEAAKGGGKSLLKATGKNVAKETFADTLVSLPLNTLDALKFSYKDGKFDKGEFAKELALNVGGDILIGGAVSGLTHGLSAVQVKKFNTINTKIQKGKTLTDAEVKFYNKHLEELGEKVEAATTEYNSVLNASRPIDKNASTYIRAKATGKEYNVPLKEDLDVAIHTDGTVELKSTPLADVNIKDLRQYVKKYANENLVSKFDTKGNLIDARPIEIASDGKKVLITQKGINDFAEKVRGGKKSLPYAESCMVLDELIKTAKKFNESPNTKGRVNPFSYYETTYKNSEGTFGVVIRIKDTPGISRYHYHSLDKLEIEKIESPTELTPKGDRDLIQTDSISTNNISNSAENVNSKKKSLDDLPRTGLQLPGEGDLLDPINTIYQNSDNVNPATKNVNQRSAELRDFIEGQLAREAELEANSGTTFKEYSNNASEDIGYTTFHKTEAERLKAENQSPKDAFENAQRISPDEVPKARQTAVKLANQVEDDVAEIIEPWVREGLLNKKVLQSQEDAIMQAKKELADGRLYDNFLDSKVESDEHLFMARSKVLLEDLMKKAPESNEAAEMLLKVMDKATEASSHAGRLLNATKLLLRNTPEGRIRIISKEIDRLNTKFASRLKGKELKLSDEQIQRLRNATDETIEEVANKINMEIWEDIPATWFEKFNEIRHTSMLFNAKTHIRNVTGNAVFWQARLMSDGIEIAINKIPAVRKRIEKLGGRTEMVHVTRKELSDNKDILNEIFNQNYQKSGSKNRYIESSRPDGAPIVKNKAGNWLIQTNYKLLEKEDLITFKPEYRKNFIRWCKANDVPLEDIPNLTKAQMQKADAYAIKQAERATFRDNSAFASKIVGLKQKTATKKGKTVLGTVAYRTANVALESNLPFVKTPVNILRRSIDYSPLGLARSTVELATAKTADDFMQGVHHLATGLTGSGVFALGMWLANNDLITVKTGEVSGDAYYDRDMGYQDYSLLLNFDGQQYSMTIDWLSPMQTSLFMGAEAWSDLAEENWTLEDMFDGLTAVAGPMLDMSFMSSSKDTIEMFMERVYRNGTGDDADWSGAIFQTLFGSVPQGYLNSFVPQVFSQTAQAFDNMQRDTSSTLEDPVANSWDSWRRKMINKIPGLRNKLLNPKLDRFGNDKETGNNIVTRFLNAYVNPSNVKKINLTKLDKEIIKIYNHMEDGTDEKKFFYYNFTGHPNYDLGNGKRMSYDEAYQYGKENRRQQTKLIEDMVGSASYKNMTWEMKADEVKGAHFIGQTHADRKTYGNNYARNQIIRSGSSTDRKAAELSKSAGISSKDFVDFYLTKETLINRSHDSDYNTKALAVALSGNDEMAKIYDINMDKVQIAKEYLAAGGSKKEYSNAMCNVISKISDEMASVSMSNKAVAAAYYNINERTYTAMGLAEKANMGVGLKNFGYTFATLEQMRMDSKYGFDFDGSGTLKKAELMAYIDSLGLSSREEKACVFAYFSTAKNPYGSVPNYLGFSNTGTSSGGGSGRSYSRSSGKSTKTAAETTQKANMPSWEDYVKDFITESEKVSGVTFKDWDSPLDQSYRNKINSILKKMDA